MIPDRAGVWEWFDNDGTKRLMSVFDVAAKLREATGHAEPHLRVYWWGGYYNVAAMGTGPFEEQEWPDRWGQWVGENGSIPENQIYNGPTPEQRDKIFAKMNAPKI